VKEAGMKKLIEIMVIGSVFLTWTVSADVEDDMAILIKLPELLMDYQHIKLACNRINMTDYEILRCMDKQTEELAELIAVSKKTRLAGRYAILTCWRQDYCNGHYFADYKKINQCATNKIKSLGLR